MATRNEAPCLNSRLRWIFIRQAVLATLFITLGTLLGNLLLHEALRRQAVQAEAVHVWALLARDARQPLPHAAGFDAYFVPHGQMPDSVPAELRALPPGLHRIAGQTQWGYVSERAEGRVYLNLRSLPSAQMVYLATLVTLLLAAAAVTLVAWLGWRRCQPVVQPLSELAAEALAWRPGAATGAGFATAASRRQDTHEMAQLRAALAGMAARMDAHVAREHDFTRDVSHELRTPLTVIALAAERLGQEVLEGGAEKALQRIHAAHRDMGEVLDALLLMARCEDVAVEFESLSLAEIAREKLAEAEGWRQGKPLEMRVRAEAEPWVEAPRHVLAVILLQLLRNAVRFTEAGHIEVVVKADGFSVRDTGIGMDAATLERVFDPFWRADIADYAAKGLGLPLVKRLVERCGWQLQLHSRPGEGTCVTVHVGAHLPVNR